VIFVCNRPLCNYKWLREGLVWLCVYLRPMDLNFHALFCLERKNELSKDEFPSNLREV
jgi:hypothetical protein